MNSNTLVLRGLTYYWRTNVAVVIGVGTAVAVLAGALLVGDSVRGSLRDLVLQRLGRTDQIVTSVSYFREQLVSDLQKDPAFNDRVTGVAPLVAARGLAISQDGGRRAGHVRVYGVDDRFWRFHGVSDPGGPSANQAFISPALAAELNAGAGTAILVRVQRPSGIPLESLFGEKDDLARAIRLDVQQVVPPDALGEFSLEPQQADVRAVFVPLAQLQKELEIAGRVNVLLLSASSGASGDAVPGLERLIRSQAALEDVGLRVKTIDVRRAVAIESDSGLLTDAQAAAIQQTMADARPQPVFTYLANSLRSGGREVPYSLVTATDLNSLVSGFPVSPKPSGDGGSRTEGGEAAPPIILNDWTARELMVGPGDPLTLEYYLWEEAGRLVTRTSEFRVAGVVPVEAGDRDLAPVYPGITDSPSLGNWDPPFPLDLNRVRPVDEEYWNAHRTTPKAFIPIDVGRRLWRSRYGSLTSVRLPVAPTEPLDTAARAFAERLRANLDPLSMGLAARNVRAEGLDASRGATDFGEYFIYFSFFLVVSALLLAALFFKLSVEQRGREIGLLRAVGIGSRDVLRLFLAEALVLSLAGSIIGVAGGMAYAWLLMAGLRTWWVDAVGTTALTLHVSPASLAAGALGGVAAAMACIVITLRRLGDISERSLLTGQLTRLPDAATVRAPRGYLVAAFAAAGVGAALMAGAMAGFIDRGGAFFGAGASLLAACLFLPAFRLRNPRRRPIEGRGWVPVTHLGARSVTYRPGRSVLAMAVVASATFILIAVDAFRRDDRLVTGDPKSGVGGYSLLVETMFPVARDPDTPEGREALGLADLGPAAPKPGTGDGGPLAIEPFRVLEGDEASCLNLYEPKNPRILAPRDAFVAGARFTFQSSLASTDAERANPWLLLNRAEPGAAVPVIADANSMTYVLHRGLGEEFTITRGGQPIRLQIVAALRDSIFQGELLMSDADFRRLFPDQEGFQFFLVDVPNDRRDETARLVEDALADFGGDATGTAERLAAFHKVENTYLSTFQTLGGLGLLLGTVGLAAVLLRNALERRKELALLGAVGFERRHFLMMVLAENAVLVGGGLAAGAVSAALAIAPAVAERGGRIPITSGAALLLFAVLVTSLMASMIATLAATRAPLLESLRAD
jgi:ABC-type lipoprotein release transport system permease subunit